MSVIRKIDLPDGTALNARLEGPEGAPVVVFSNSVMTDLSVWDGQMSALSAYQVLRYDQRGHGASDVSDAPLDFDILGADLLAVLDAFSIERCVFVGLSMGVPTGLAALGAAPERFAGFVGVDGIAKSAGARAAFWTERRETALDQGMETIAEGTVGRWLPGVAATDSRATTLSAMIAATPAQGFASATYALEKYDHSAPLATMTVPFFGIIGALDGAMPDTIKSQFSAVPEAEFALVEGAGHVPNFQSPDAFNTLLLPFLERVAPVLTKEAQ